MKNLTKLFMAVVAGMLAFSCVTDATEDLGVNLGEGQTTTISIALDDEARSLCALAVHPFNHSCNGEVEPINFENGTLKTEFGNYKLQWIESIRKNEQAPFEKGKDHLLQAV